VESPGVESLRFGIACYSALSHCVKDNHKYKLLRSPTDTFSLGVGQDFNRRPENRYGLRYDQLRVLWTTMKAATNAGPGIANRDF
jgi:hypothetical protein